MIYDASPTTIENCGERIVELENSLQALLSLKFAPEQCLQRLSSLKSGSQSVVDSIHQFIADASKSLQETHSGQELRSVFTFHLFSNPIAPFSEHVAFTFGGKC